MLMANSDSSSSILPRSPLIPNPVETLDESSSPIASIGAHVVQSLAISSPNRGLDDDLPTKEVSISPLNSDGPPLDEALVMPCPVSLKHGEGNDAQVMPESQIQPLNHSERNILSTPVAPDEIYEDSILDMYLSDNHKHPHGYDTDDECIQSLCRLKQEPQEIVQPTCVGVGLWNLGNSCFVNSILQCFTHTVPLIECLCSYKSPDPCNCGNERFCVIRTLRGHMNAALVTSRYSISPFYFLNNLNYFSPDFLRFQQEDAHEFLQAFLDKLELCCLDRRSYRGSISSQDFNMVQYIFGGRLVSGLRCCNCNSVSETFENSLGLSLEIEDVYNLQSALDSFTRVEKLDEPMTCDNCKEKVSKEKQLLLDKLPLVVTFHLKRFKNNGFFMEKIFNHVEFPLELDLQPYMRSQNNQVATKYNLYAFVEHLGSLAYGHYSSYVRSAPKIWHHFDDKQVTRINEDSVLSKDSYILFYAKEGTPWFSSTFEELHRFREASVQDSSPNSVLDPTNGECSSEISYENVYKSNKRCDDSAGVSDMMLHVKTEENCVSLSNEFDEDVWFQSAESSGEDSPIAEPLDQHDPDDDKSNKRYHDSAGVSVKTEENCVSLSYEFDEDVLSKSGESSGEDSPMAEPLDLHDSNNPFTEKEADSCLATGGDDMVQKQEEGTFQIQLEQSETEEEEACKQPLLISDVAESKETEVVHRGLMKKPSPSDRELDQGIPKSGSPPKKLKTA